MSTQSSTGDDATRARLAHLLALVPAISTAELLTGRLAPATRDTIRAFQRRHDLGVSGVLDAATAAYLDENGDGAQGTMWVAGQVRHADGRPAAGLTVTAADRDLRREQFLGGAPTDDGGYFRIGYDAERFARAEKRFADLLVRVDDGRRILHDPGIDGIIFNAGPVTTLTIDLDDTGERTVESEYELILRTITPLLDDVALADLREDADTHDVTFLAAESGIAAHRIAWFGLAHKVAAARQLPAEFCYALFAKDAVLGVGGAAALRTYVDLNTPVEPLYADIALLAPEAVRTAVTAAIGELIVGESLADALDRILARLAADRDDAQEYVARERPAAILATINPRLADGTLARLTALTDTNVLGDLNGLLARLHEEAESPRPPDRASGGGAPADDLPGGGLTMLAGVLGLDGHLITEVRERHGITGADDAYRLAHLSHTDWTAALGEHPLADLHAAALVERMQARFPTAALAANLTRDTAAFADHRDPLVRFFAAHPTLDLATANLDVLLRERPVDGMRDATPAGADDAATPAGSTPAGTIKAIQRVFRLAPTYSQTKSLLDAGITSAAQIHTLDRARFVRTAQAGGAFTPQQAHVAFAKAVQVHVAATMLAGRMQALPAATTVAGLSAPLPPGTLAKVGADFPTFKSLFGTGDSCACDECRSVHSPAAYLVDVLQFLKHRAVVDLTGPPGAQHIAKDVLLTRRPDLGDTDLNCANTNTALPYLDLVCELLEEAIAPDPGFSYAGPLAADTNAAGDPIGPVDPALLAALQTGGLPFTPDAIMFPVDLAGAKVVRDAQVVAKLVPSGGGWVIRELRQTYGTAAELAAAPKYVNQAAYTVLAASPIAFGLPFDLAHAEALSYLTQAGVPRAALMRALQSGGTPSDAAIAAQGWGLSDAERALIVTVDPGAQQAIWHTAGPAAATLANVGTFVDRTGIEFTELRTLLALGWVDPTGALTVRSTAPGCDLSTRVIDGLDAAALDRLHRFIRLWRATGWSPAALDRAIRAVRLGNGQLDDAFLVAARGVQDVVDRLQWSVDDAIDLYDVLPWDSDGSRYAAVYLNAPAVGTVLDALRPAQVTAGGAGTPLSTYRSYLALCLGVTADEVDALLAALPAPADTTAEHLAALSALRRLATATRLSIADLAIVLQVTAVDPLVGPADTIAFLDAVSAIRDAGSTPADLRYLLRHEADNLTAWELTDAAITGVLTRLQSAYRAARTADAWTGAASDPLDQQRAALATLLATVPGLTTADVAGIMSIVDGSWADPTVTAAAFLTAKLAGAVDAAALATILGNVVAAPTDAQRSTAIQAIGAGVAAARYTRDKHTALVTELGGAFAGTAQLLTAVLAAVLAAALAAAGGRRLDDLLTDETVAGPPGAAPPPITPAAFDEQFRALRLAREILGLAAGLGLTAGQLAWTLANAGALGWLVPDELPYQSGIAPIGYPAWRRLAGGVALMAAHPPVVDPAAPDRPYTMLGFLDLVRAAAPLTDVVGYASALAGWDAPSTDAIAAYLGLATADFADPAALARLGTAVTLVRTLGVPVAQAIGLVAPTLTPADAANLRTSLKARYAEADWLGVLRTIQDRLRERKRDALVCYLLAVNPHLAGAEDLFDSFLIDVQMGACMPTSRIVQAHATVQVFVQRSLMGLEPTCVADVRSDSGWAQWTWMAQFRVWEANRKVFLWPENWLIPEVRDDRSEQFRALENRLRQGTLTEVAVQDATAAYLEGLDDIAYLEVMATYYQTATGVMHVFARTRDGDGRTYFHRTFIRERAWTPWETVPLDITGEHLSAFERNGRLTLAWPMFRVDANTSMQLNLTDPLPSGPTPPPEQRLNIGICVSEFANGRWRAKKVSHRPVMYPADGTFTSSGIPDPDTLTFFVTDLGSAGQSIVCVTDTGTIVGAFALTGCKGYPEPIDARTTGSYLLYPRFRNTTLRAEKHLLDSGKSGSDLTQLDLAIGAPVELLGRTPKPGRFQVTHPMQFTHNDFLVYLVRLLIGGSGAAAATSPAETGDGSRYRVPLSLGTFMPYFYGDYDRGYVIVPGLYPAPLGRTHSGGPLPTGDRTYADLNQFIVDATALARKYLAGYAKEPDLPRLIERLVADPEYVRLLNYVTDLRKHRYGVRFANFYHPLVCALRRALDSGGVDALMRRDVQLRQTAFDFQATYDPRAAVRTPYPIEDIDFSLAGAYSSYNWELFFHLPYAIARRLSDDQQYVAAQNWLHYIFNPVGVIDPDLGAGPAPTAPAKYWITKPFFQRTPADYAAQLIDAISNKMALDPAALHIDDLAFAVAQWREHPFAPYVVARSRTVAFQIATVTAYARNLLAWADSQFRTFTRESVTAATQLYLMVEKLLGARPRIIEPEVKAPTETYHQLEASLDIFGNAMVDVENLIPGWPAGPPAADPWMPAPISASSLYFCIPPNEELRQLWDVVADRLFKIRHCRNIDGVESMLALFAPPIDPGALVRALAAGGDLASVIAGLGAPPPAYRFAVMTQKATELVGHVAALGGELLSAVEKRDAEALGTLRARQEQTVLHAVREVKTAAIDEATANITAIGKTRAVTQARRDHYAGQEFMNADESAAADIYQGIAVGEGLLGLGYVLAGVLTGVPDFMIGVAGFGGSPAANATQGGTKLATATELGTKAHSSLLKVLETTAGMTATQGAFRRRSDEWALQVALADKELAQLDQQIANAQLHVTMLTRELAAHDKQVTHAADTLAYLSAKFTNQDLYEWTIAQISAVYFQAYQLAFDTAKKAERCFEHELGADAGFVNGPYWDSLKNGLRAADALLHDIKRMELAYLDRNKRELELTKHVSLAQIDPAALLTLRNTGRCDFEIPEVAFDLDYPGHYFRRLKAVSMSIPCVVGPYTTVNATLSLVGNRYRAKPTLRSSGTPAARYAENPTGDDRFVYQVGAIQSIATSTGVTDSGVFELNFHDERYLPFEGCGAISRWHLELPAGFRQFDYASISDVLLHLRYTARADGALNRAASDALAAMVNDFAHAVGANGLFQTLSLRDQFPDSWWQLSRTKATTVTIGAQHLPYWVRARKPAIVSVTWYASIPGTPASPNLTVGGVTVPLAKAAGLTGVYTATSAGLALGAATTLGTAGGDLADLVGIVKYTVS